MNSIFCILFTILTVCGLAGVGLLTGYYFAYVPTNNNDVCLNVYFLFISFIYIVLTLSTP